ncbi:hypothetical protein FGB62_586g00 [Gracilaria domingensis]|nr:hypothetical protein FGB62_586g00 [Gracilaria domingensis]
MRINFVADTQAFVSQGRAEWVRTLDDAWCLYAGSLADSSDRKSFSTLCVASGGRRRERRSKNEEWCYFSSPFFAASGGNFGFETKALRDGPCQKIESDSNADSRMVQVWSVA